MRELIVGPFALDANCGSSVVVGQPMVHSAEKVRELIVSLFATRNLFLGAFSADCAIIFECRMVPMGRPIVCDDAHVVAVGRPMTQLSCAPELWPQLIVSVASAQGNAVEHLHS